MTPPQFVQHLLDRWDDWRARRRRVDQVCSRASVGQGEATVMPKTIICCTICGEEAPNAGRDMCQRCYNYLYYRRVRRPGRNLPRPVRRTSLTDRIEIEIALGTPTRDIMTRLDIDYGVVKGVRDAMDEAS